MLSVKENVICSAYFLDLVDWKAQKLVQRNKSIQNHQGNNDAVNDGARDQVHGPGSFDQGPQAQLMVGGLLAHVEYPLIEVSDTSTQSVATTDALS